MVLTIATVLGLVGPIAAFGLFYLGDRVLHIDRPQLQTMMYLLLSVAGHLTIFQTRTRGAWWTVRPARILLLAVVGTQVVATCICLFGFLVTPLWWGWAALVWGYALAWFLVTDPIKLLAYRYLDATKTAAPKRQDKIATDAAKSDCAKPARLKAGDVTVAQAKAENRQGEHRSRARRRWALSEVRSVLDMKLGDLLAAGRANELEGAVDLIAKAISEIEKRPTRGRPACLAPPNKRANSRSLGRRRDRHENRVQGLSRVRGRQG